MSRRNPSAVQRVAFLTLFAATAWLLLVGPAQAAAPAPAWSIDSFATPTVFSAADGANPRCPEEGVQALCDAYQVTVTNIGSRSTDGSPVTVSDTLPEGLTVLGASFFWSGLERAQGLSNQTNLASLYCTSGATVRCKLPFAVAPEDTLEMFVYVVTPPGSQTLLNHVSVSVHGVPTATTEAANRAGGPAPDFGAAHFDALATGPDGSPLTQAGGHPQELYTRIDFNNVFGATADSGFGLSGVEDPKDIAVDLPIGFLGSAEATPRCTFAQLSATFNHGLGGCPSESIVGQILTEPESGISVRGAIYNMLPERGAAAQFGFLDVNSGPHVLSANVVPTSGGYVLRTTAEEIPEITLTTIIANFFGQPGARNGSGSSVPMFTSPADCNGEPLRTTVHMDSWEHPGSFLPDGEPDLSDPNWVASSSESPPVTGCDQLNDLFRPTLEAHPTTTQGDQPAGFDVTLKVPQQEDAETLATPPLKKAVVTLPAGMSVNPSSANGLAGCSLAEIGVAADGQPDGEPVRCPDASKIGTLELRSPDLPGTLEGEVYVAKQSENPFGSLLALYFVVDDPTTGVLVKIPGEVRADPASGQLTAVIDNSPQFPFSELKTTFFGGQKAALRTPAVCGAYKVTSVLTPWSAPESGPPAEPSGSFEISGDCAPSAAQQPHAPSFEAGTESPFAGAFSPFLLKLHRDDGSQEISGLSVALAPGLLAKLAGVPECPESALALARSREHEGGGAEELAAPSCPPGSEVGTVTVGAGAGLTPYYTKGRVYLAGAYKGAPLSLAIVTPAVAGPFDLGDVVVRTALRVDPYTARVTAASDELPHILDGIPLDIRSIALQMDRSNFTLNPTNCETMALTGTATSVLGQNAPLTQRFQVGGCRRLGFKPKLALSLKGATRRSGNPALKAVLTYPNGAYANIAYAQVSLPHTLFLDQGNLDKVCTQPELLTRTCPATSVYGRVKAWTPLLDQPLEGNVYLGVGFGHELPDLVGELNGQIRVLLHGKVDTDKADGLRNTFEVVPDAPVSKFVLELKGGSRYGLLENHENLCLKQVRAGAKFIGQNGKVDNFRPVIKTSCKAKGKGKKHGHRGRR